ncbi:MAG TPA: glycoside hydrolase family 127 protein [Haliscomenobacter sp.]|uniref:beta-L-arabinofuranosidase domain-containing protein n=1 Tax=Haliscomenobacter sp. TaxID=2717303 RepID=UPI002D102C11|nr:beta-L-arabinofuranosidase domain-containing protein [Haliscomenobacter sp.]HOY19396.1 glycoside hydrolase family 127 protein [Haliscomenobacter sp.]
MKKTGYFLLIGCLFVGIIQGWAQSLPIEGKWKYSFADSSTFLTPQFVDTDWQEIEGRLIWQKKDLPSSSNIVWLRKSLIIPSSLKKELSRTGVLVLMMGQIQQTDETYLNGKLIGKTGTSDLNRNYLIYPEDIRWDQENSIAIRMSHWGERCSISGKPTLAGALPEHIFSFGSAAKNASPTQQVHKQASTYQFLVNNNSTQAAEGIAKANFYDFAGKQLFSAEQKVVLAPGANTLEFPYTSPSSFLKIVYTLSIPSYNYTSQWNSEFGYNNVNYIGVAPVVPYLVKDNYTPADLNKQIIGGWLGEKLQANVEKRLHKVDEKALLAGFINRPGNHSWVGEHIGKFLEAACNAYANSADPALKIQIDRSAQQLIAAQLSDGYLGTYAPDKHWTSWDVWSHKYDLVGLLRYYELSGFKPALAASEKIGNLLVQTFGYESGQKDLIKAGTHVGMAATSILDPMTDLYRFSGNKKYLDFCFYIIKSFNQPNGPRIISTLDSLGRVDKTANAKAYEMLSNLVGLVKLYRITGDQLYLKPVLTAWKDIVNSRLYITGTASSHEHFQDDHLLPASNKDNMGEGCVTTTWIQLNFQLCSIFGEMKYVDELERSVYNHLIGAENPQTGCVSYYTPLNGQKPYGCAITCCMSSIPRGIAMVPLFANGKIKGNPSFLFYQPGTYKTTVGNTKNTVEFKTDTRFPSNGKVMITVNPLQAATFKVTFRKPYWAEDFSISVNNVKQSIGTAELVTIERLWKKGDLISINFNLPVKILDGNKSYAGQIALQRGPQVLVFDQILNKKSAGELTLTGNTIQLEEAPTLLPQNWVGTQAYQVKATANGVLEKLILVPYADAGQTGGTISTWLSKQN